LLEIKEVTRPEELRQFADLADIIYKNDPNWVAPIQLLERAIIKGFNKPQNPQNPSTLLLAREGKNLRGRIGVGIDSALNQSMGTREGYITLFECVNDYPTAEALFDRATGWLRERGMDLVRGPNSKTGDDNYRGLLIEGFDGPPYFMNPYNPDYYPEFFDRYGFTKDADFFAFHIDLARYPADLYGETIKKAMQRFAVRIDKVGFFRLERDITDIKTVIDESWPEDWDDLLPPSREDLLFMSKKLRWIMPMDGMLIARSGDRPVGFVIAMPDYNQALKPLNGRLLPGGILKFLWYKRKITAARIMVLFVVPEFRRKVVAEALFHRLIAAGKGQRYTRAEASVIGEKNQVMMQTVQAVGGRPYRTYRTYKKELS